MKEESSHDDYYDLTINRASFTTAQAIDLILLAIEKKQILADCQKKMEFF
jgi:hypothetical protein